ncbi:MAG TPA: vitamin B12-dependent ribonucleotide reductase [Armatimonadota bacterium]|nr:vitamin B12-dependent ribonucleotide reductase [Armatimonadota bacterium]
MPSLPHDLPLPHFAENALTVLQKRYLRKNEEGNPTEEPWEMFWRVARDVASASARYDPAADVEAEAREFYRAMAQLDFLPNSPTLMNAGRELQQLSACFVLPVEDSMESIFETIKDTALIHQSGGGTGFSFSRLRPQGDIVRTTGGIASGPVSFMKVFNAATEAVKQGGTRRGANMAILRVDHPDIVDFITAKRDTTQLTNFNISVGLTEEFMEAVRDDTEYDLVNPRTKKVVQRCPARDIFDMIVQGAWATGEPGIVFLDRLNASNPTPELGEIESTNPCGEQPLLPYEACNLGSINLAHFVKQGDRPEIDFDRLGQIVRTAVRFLDNVIDVNQYPLDKIAKMARGNRKIGLGVMGFADMLIQLGLPYDSDAGLETAGRIMDFIHGRGREASAEIARERGVFPNFDKSLFAQGGPRLRNATVTTIAPTGTLSIIAGCSSGIEPLFAIVYTRRILDGQELLEVHPLFEKIACDRAFYSQQLMQEIGQHKSLADVGAVPEDVRRLFVTAYDIAPEWHIRMQGEYQKHTDNAVSKTVNVRNEATRDDIHRVYMLAHELGCKGVTVYRDGSRDSQVLTVGSHVPATVEPAQPVIAKAATIQPRPRPTITEGSTEKIKTGCGNLYITVNEDEQGLCEVFTTIGKSGGCTASQSEATARMISLVLRSGVDPKSIVDELKGIRCPMPSWDRGSVTLSCADAVGKAIERFLSANGNGRHDNTAGPKGLPMNDIASIGFNPECPECGSMLELSEGCVVCRACGYSRCT